jgi:uncharacterized ubiquitin-like protein YukD
MIYVSANSEKEAVKIAKKGLIFSNSDNLMDTRVYLD